MLISLQSTLNSIIMNNWTNNNLEKYLYTNTLATIWLLVISYILVEFDVKQCAVILTDILFCNLLMYWLYNLQLFWLFHGRFEVTCRPVTWRHMEYLSMLALVHEGKTLIKGYSIHEMEKEATMIWFQDSKHTIKICLVYPLVLQYSSACV